MTHFTPRNTTKVAPTISDQRRTRYGFVHLCALLGESGLLGQTAWSFGVKGYRMSHFTPRNTTKVAPTISDQRRTRYGFVHLCALLGESGLVGQTAWTFRV